MNIKIQPPEVRRRNAKLIALAIVVSIPFYCWALFADLDDAPRWLPITALGLDLSVVVVAIAIAKRYMNRAKGSKHSPDADTGSESSGNTLPQ